MFQYNLFLNLYIASCLWILEQQAELAGVTIRYLDEGEAQDRERNDRITVVLTDGIIRDIFIG